MFRTLLKTILVIMALACMGGCDPETMTKEKVPSFIKDLLTFGGPGSPKQVQSIEAALQITSPKPNQVFPADKDVVFQADLPRKDEKAPGPDLVWQVVPETGGQSQAIGRGLSAAKRLRPGNYRAELQASVGEQKVVKTVAFRVSIMMAGKVALRDGAGVAQADVELVDLKQKKTVFKTQSRNDGAFSLELPSDDEYKVIIRKPGYLISPVSREIKSPKDGPLEYSAQKGDITDIHLTQAEDSETNIRMLCPADTVFLKCKIQLDTKPSSLQVTLVDPRNEGRPISFDPKEIAILGQHTDASGFTKLRVVAPSASAIGQPADSYVIWIKVQDEKQDSYLVQFPEPIAVDYGQCFSARLATGVEAQQKGNGAEAIRIYSLMENMFNAIYKVKPYMDTMDKAFFNRGLAYLQAAFDDKDEASHTASLTKSIQDLDRYIKARRNDGKAYMLRGAAHQARGDYAAAIRDYDSSIELLPRSGQAFGLRGQVDLKLGTNKNLLQAIDDFTASLEADPGNKTVREARKEATKLAIKYRDSTGDQKVDTSQISIEPLKAWLDLPKYLLK